MEMRLHGPTATMKIVTIIERVQPTTCADLDANGELVWEGQAMPRFQMAMFPVPQYAGDFLAYWKKLQIRENWDLELDCINAEFRSYVYGKLGDKYEKARQNRKGKGD